jgi:hypothetical protein
MDRARRALDRVRSAYSAVGSALRDAPVWALVVLGVLVVAVVGEVVFVIAQSDGDGDSPAAAEPLGCNDREADNAVNADRFAQAVRDLGTVPPLASVLEVYDAKVIDCADLDGDESDEMVVQLLERDVPLEDTVDLPRPWAIYVSDGEKWTPALIRSQVPGAAVAVKGDEVRERSSALVEGDLLCCPTGRREGVVRWDGNRFTYHPDVGPRGRTVALADEAAVGLGGFDLQEGSFPDAVELFGPASTYGPEGDTCPASWDDLGMTIEFANLGGLDPCGDDGRVAEARIESAEASQAGWKTEEDATVEMPEEELRKLYPDMRPAAEDSLDPEEPVGELFILVDRPSTVGLDEPTPTLSARVAEGRVVGYVISVGAAGE